MTIQEIVKRCKELHLLKGRPEVTVLVLDFFRTPDLSCTIQFVDDDDKLSSLYHRKIKSDKKGQYFLIDSKKYYLKNIVV